MVRCNKRPAVILWPYPAGTCPYSEILICLHRVFDKQELSLRQKDFDDRAWTPVVVPHDWAVTLPFSRACSSGTSYLPGGTGWYRLRFHLPEDARGKRLWVCFDGVYKNCQVWINGHNLGKHAYGYTPFRFDVSAFVSFAPSHNVLSVKVRHEDIADSRWFTGSGITRKVSLEAQEPVCFGEYGVFFTTPQVSAGQAVVRVSSTVENTTAAPAGFTLRHTLRDAQGSDVALLQAPVDLTAGETRTVTLEGAVANPHLWSTEDPYLYALVSEMLLDGQPQNRQQVAVGICEYHFCPDTGFHLNGQSSKLKGVCLHHDGGCLGAAVPKTAWRRRLQKLKAMGCNAIRMAHNPHSPEPYDLCDEMGFLVIDEAFDEWEGTKNKWSTGHNVYPPKHQGYAEDFPNWHDGDLRAMVRRDRNHPSVILWSIGNEIDYPNDPYVHPMFNTMTGNNDSNKPEQERMYNPNRPNMERIPVIAAQLAGIVRQEDDTRPVTAAASFPELSSYIGFLDPLDVVGYNYKEEYYEEDHRRFPLKPFLGSENGQSLSAWKAVTDHDYIAGQFLWTGIDFLGEAHGWPIHGSMAGLLTLAGYEKPTYYFRRSLWAQEPVAQLATTRKAVDKAKPWMRHEGDALVWDYVPGEEVTVRCFTNCPTVDIRLNSASLGVFCLADFANDGFVSCQVPYQPGTLEAMAAAADRAELLADGEDIAQIEVTVVDAQGNWAPHAADMIHVTVEGAGTLLGIENGDQADNTDYSAPHRRAYHGRLLVYVRAGEQTGPITVTCRTAGSLRDAVVKLQAK